MTGQQYLDSLLNTYQLVKVLADKNECRVLHLRHREMKRNLILRQFRHPVPIYEMLCGIACHNLPQVYDVIPHEDGTTVLEEFIEGVTVADIMQTKRYTYREAKAVIRGVCHGLSVLHKEGFVHRDVKPENVMVTNDGRVVLIDLNISRQVTEATRDTKIMGTVGYASPEQLGLTQSDARTDIYAVGVLFNVMLTGKHPSEQLARGWGGWVIRRCTAVSPDERYQTAEKLAMIV